MSQMMSNVPAMLPMERLLGHVSEVEVVDCRECRVMGACILVLAQSLRCMVLVRMLPIRYNGGMGRTMVVEDYIELYQLETSILVDLALFNAQLICRESRVFCIPQLVEAIPNHDQTQKKQNESRQEGRAASIYHLPTSTRLEFSSISRFRSSRVLHPLWDR